MSRRLDIGVASYRNPERLRATLTSIEAMSTTDWRCVIVHNPSPDSEGAMARHIANDVAARDQRYSVLGLTTNEGYAGALIRLQERFIQTPGWGHFAYFDNDVEILTRGWDEILSQALDDHPEIGMVFPGEQPYQIPREGYIECMWGVGFAFLLTRKAITEAGLFDSSIGHQNEADYALRVRMAGYRCACLPFVGVRHHATATKDLASSARINRGVVEFVDKWNRYFNGKTFGYHSPNVTRWLDWPPNALFMEEYFKINGLSDLNVNAETVAIKGEQFDLIRVPRPKDFYKSRII